MRASDIAPQVLSGFHLRMQGRRESSAGKARVPSRREVLGLAALAGLSLVPRARSEAQTSPLQLAPGTPLARVVRATFPHAVVGATVHRTIVREMLHTTLTRLTRTDTTREAWHAILKPSDVVGIKFNRSGQRELGTTPAVGEALLESLIEAGWTPERIVCIEAPPDLEQRYGTTPARWGYEPNPTEFGSGSDQLALVLQQVTALIDVPFLKTHNIAGMTGCLKNLSHGLIKHPARYHRNGCSPFIADIVSLEQIRGKLRLCLMDALRTVCDGGPKPAHSNIVSSGILLASFDAVATDITGLGILSRIRRGRNLPIIPRAGEHLPQLADAHCRGLGIALQSGIDVVNIKP